VASGDHGCRIGIKCIKINNCEGRRQPGRHSVPLRHHVHALTLATDNTAVRMGNTHGVSTNTSDNTWCAESSREQRIASVRRTGRHWGT